MRAKASPSLSVVPLVNVLIGITGSAALAALMAALFNTNPYKLTLPLVFIAVMVVVALRFGALAGIFGGLTAALVFAYFLFTPVGSFRVEKETARSNIGWMLLIGIPASYFLDAGRKRMSKD